MNNIEHDILTRCLHMIYTQLLTYSSDTALESIERLIYLIRYLSNPVSQSTLAEELHTIQEVFNIYPASASFEIDCSSANPQTLVQRCAIVYEICQHGMELMHNGYALQSLSISQEPTQLTYTFTDTSQNIFRGTIYGQALNS